MALLLFAVELFLCPNFLKMIYELKYGFIIISILVEIYEPKYELCE